VLAAGGFNKVFSVEGVLGGLVEFEVELTAVAGEGEVDERVDGALVALVLVV